MEIRHDRYGKRIARITCPDCGYERWMRLQNFERGSKTGLCLKCFNARRIYREEMVVGDKRLIKDGYVFVECKGHPRAAFGGFVKRAAIVLERMLGRHLRHDEHIHHINGKRDDDRPENLAIITNSEHARLHMRAKPNIKNRYIRACRA